MSNAAAAKAVAKKPGPHVTSLNIATAKAGARKQPITSKGHPFHFIYEARPKPLNCTTYPATRAIALDPSHPFYVRIQRRLAAFDASTLHWTVKCSVDLNKKSTVRNWARRRVKTAFNDALKEHGWSRDGKALEKTDVKNDLAGAVVVMLGKDQTILEADGEEVRSRCMDTLRMVIRMQRTKGPSDGQKWKGSGEPATAENFGGKRRSLVRPS